MTREEFQQRALLAALPECLARAPGQEPRMAVVMANRVAAAAVEEAYGPEPEPKAAAKKKAGASKR